MMIRLKSTIGPRLLEWFASHPLLSDGDSNAKTSKGGEGIRAAILYAAPAAVAGVGNLCAWASAGCRAACLYTAGHGGKSTVQEARIRKARHFMINRSEFLSQLHSELTRLTRLSRRSGDMPVARLNGTTDIPWEKFDVPQNHPGIQFYDYTKSKRRALDNAAGKHAANYHLTYSRVETDSPREIVELTDAGVSVAVVFDTPKGEPLPSHWHGVEVIDGRADDWRFRDPRGVIVGLSALGAAKRDTTGFVVNAPHPAIKAITWIQEAA